MIGRELVREDPDEYLPRIAANLGFLGLLGELQGRMDEARSAYEDSLKSYRELARGNPNKYLRFVAMTLMTLTNIGLQGHNQSEIEEARAAVEEALVC